MTFSYQLYSSRKFGPLEATLKMVSDLGYSQVEGYGALYASLDDVEALKASLAANRLSMSSGHFALDMVEQTPEKVIDIARNVGMRYVFVPHLAEDQRPTTDQGWRDFGARLQDAGKPIRNAGLKFGWHNHDFEFSKTGGEHPLDLILEGGPDLDLELDVAWVVRGEQDPFEWIERHADRLVAAHVKDIAPEGEKSDEDGWADVGDGVMDWPGLVRALTKARCELMVAEHDNPSDDARFASRSIAFLNDQ